MGGSASIDASACKPCPPNSQSPQASTSLEQCICNGITDADPTGYYWDPNYEGFDAQLKRVDDPKDWDVCKACPVGSDCRSAGSKLSNIVVLSGYYRCTDSNAQARTQVGSRRLMLLTLGFARHRVSNESTDLRSCPDFTGETDNTDSACVGGVWPHICLEWTDGPCA